VTGPSEAAIRDGLPEGFALLGDNLAPLVCASALAEAAASREGGPLPGDGGGGRPLAARPFFGDDGSSDVLAAPASDVHGTLVASSPEQACFSVPTCVFIAVSRASPLSLPEPASEQPALSMPAADDARVRAHADDDDGSSGGTQPIMRDAALVVLCVAASDESDDAGTAGASARWPQAGVPAGYALQVVDVSLAPCGRPGSGQPASGRLALRLLLAHSTDVAAVLHWRASSGHVIRLAAPASAAGAATFAAAPPAGSPTAGLAGDGTRRAHQQLLPLEAPRPPGEHVATRESRAAAPTPQPRALLIARITSARAEHASLLRASKALHRQLACLLAMRAGERGGASGGGGDGGGGGGSGAADREGSGVSAACAAADKEQRYAAALKAVVAERAAADGEAERFDGAAMALQAALDAKEARADSVDGAFEGFRRKVASEAVDSRTGLRLPRALIERYECADRDKAAELACVQLRAIYMGNQAAELAGRLASKQQLTDGLAMVDFEQVRGRGQAHTAQWVWDRRLARRVAVNAVALCSSHLPNTAATRAGSLGCPPRTHRPRTAPSPAFLGVVPPRRSCASRTRRWRRRSTSGSRRRRACARRSRARCRC